MLKQPDDFETKAIRYAHRILLVLFLGTLIIVGCAESCNRIHDVRGSARNVPLDSN